MVAKVVRMNGKLVIELDGDAVHAIGAVEGGELELRVQGDEIVLTRKVSPEFDRAAREIAARHAETFAKLAK